MSFLYPNGIGYSTGDSLVTASPLHTNGSAYFVDATTGNASYSGLSRQRPLDTLVNAYAAAASGDLIVLMDGHAETITSTITMSNDVTVVGEGRSDGKPTVKITNNQAAAAAIACSGFVMLRNIWFEEQAQACSATCVDASGEGVAVIGCYFEGDENTNHSMMDISAAGAHTLVKGCTFLSNATDNTDAPSSGLRISGTPIQPIYLLECVFDGGEYGFTNYGLWAPNAATIIRGDSLSFLRGADYLLNASSEGYIQPTTSTGAVFGSW